ncbi:MAG: hypothetical protein ACFFBD_00650 [Candidatus Hodarchaeota archaeon]
MLIKEVDAMRKKRVGWNLSGWFGLMCLCVVVLGYIHPSAGINASIASQLNTYEQRTRWKNQAWSPSYLEGIEHLFVWNGSVTDYASDVTLDSGDVYIAGSTYSYGMGGEDLLLIKCNQTGHQMWNRTWGGTQNDSGMAVASNTQGTIYTLGSTESFGEGSEDLVVIKWNAAGNQVWNRTWGTTGVEKGMDIVVDRTENIYTLGRKDASENALKLVLIKWNNQGEQLWNRTGLSIEDVLWSSAWSMEFKPEEGIYAVGTLSLTRERSDLCLLKWDIEGHLMWNRTWGGADHDYGKDLAIDQAGHIYTTGSTGSFGDDHGNRGMVIKWDSEGRQVWNSTWNGTISNWGVSVDPQGTIYTTGYTFKDNTPNSVLGVGKWNTSGHPVGIQIWGNQDPQLINWGSKKGIDLVLDSNGTIYCLGYVSMPSTGSLGHNFIVLVIFSPTNFQTVVLPTSTITTAPGFETILAILTIGGIGVRWKKRKRSQILRKD